MIKAILTYLKIIIHAIFTGCLILFSKNRKLKVSHFQIVDSNSQSEYFGNSITIKISLSNAIFIKADKHLIRISRKRGTYTLKLPIEKGKNFIKLKMIGLFQIGKHEILTFNNSPEILTPKIKKISIVDNYELDGKLFSGLNLNTKQELLEAKLNSTIIPKLITPKISVQSSFPILKYDLESLDQELNNKLN